PSAAVFVPGRIDRRAGGRNGGRGRGWTESPARSGFTGPVGDRPADRLARPAFAGAAAFGLIPRHGSKHRSLFVARRAKTRAGKTSSGAPVDSYQSFRSFASLLSFQT